MKKLVSTALALILSTSLLTACKKDEQQPVSSTEELLKRVGVLEEENKKLKEQIKTLEEQTGQTAQVEDANSDESNTQSSDTNKGSKSKELSNLENANIGDVIKDQMMDLKVVKIAKANNKVYTLGPIKLTVQGALVGKIIPKNEGAKSYLKTENSKDVIMFYYTVENTVDDKINFHPGQAQVTTDTKEQLEPDMFFGQEGGGEMLGKVQKQGFNTYYPNSGIDNIKELNFHISSPFDDNLQNFGDNLKITIKFNDKGELESIQ